MHQTPRPRSSPLASSPLHASPSSSARTEILCAVALLRAIKLLLLAILLYRPSSSSSSLSFPIAAAARASTTIPLLRLHEPWPAPPSMHAPALTRELQNGMLLIPLLHTKSRLPSKSASNRSVAKLSYPKQAPTHVFHCPHPASVHLLIALLVLCIVANRSYHRPSNPTGTT